MKFSSTHDTSIHQIKSLIIGQPGDGKTTLLGTTKEPMLILSFEAGLLSLADKNIDVADFSGKSDKLAYLKEVYAYLCTDEARKKYKWIGIDSLTELGQVIVEALKSKYPDRKDALVLWGEYSELIKRIVKNFRDLPGYHVVMTALSSIDKDEASRRFYGVNLHGKISAELPAYFDEVFHFRIFEKEDGTRSRALQTQPQENYMAKDRSGKLDLFERPDMEAIKNKIQGVKNGDSKKEN